MSAGFETLSNDGVESLRFQPSSFIARCCGRKSFGALGLKLSNKIALCRVEAPASGN
jgi:hypothetical protein